MESIIYILIATLFLTSYQGFKSPAFREKYIFDVDQILIDKEYYRVFTSAFLHSNWYHLIFNSLALSSFGVFVLVVYGIKDFTLIYMISLIGGGLLSLYLHRNHGDYRALGASGAISGVVFSTILLSPTSEISLLFIPYGFPAWAFGIAFVAYTVWGIKKGSDNIGHEAHLGGAIFGMLTTIAIDPDLLSTNYWIFVLLMAPCLIFLIFVYKNPEYLLVESVSLKSFINTRKKTYEPTKTPEEELNDLLDKISSQGIGSLTAKEKKKLEELSGKELK
ncbi:rhomboid family intramembrane serine protease [Fulvivirga sp. 29W222]|uniref:Rhomboid family intramembrane serine protease n=1 Tax=Fulvivirga marina TaxID=2494733 RepID=A0A937FU28_9BACT|nr:rhomboid family intramembrane serine protease [Fulvivirga marina]MBL6445949.1 rhomboid family intramembrane serine protease [Fulvivirga marina]